MAVEQELKPHDDDKPYIDRRAVFAGVESGREGTATVVTDHAGSIPLYYSRQPDGVVVGESALEVARRIDNPQCDPVSVADFLVNGTVCYPHSIFHDVFVAPPGSVTELTPTSISSRTYFVPEEADEKGELEAWGLRLREAAKEALLQGIEGKGRIKVLFSGGEDARAVVSLIPREIECELITFADDYNREVRLAKKAARALNRPFRFQRRSACFYRQNIRERTRLIGGGFDVRHTHVYGALASVLKDADAIIGGYGADTMFKTAWMGNINESWSRVGPESLQFPYPDAPVGIEWAAGQSWLNRMVASAVDERRWAHHRRLKAFRPRSAGNWHTLLPLGSQRVTYAHYLAIRRIGPSVVEPFLAPQVYRLAAVLPDQFRVDRRVFRAAFGPGLGPAGWCQTSSGGLPRLGGYLGHWVKLGTLGRRRLQDATRGRIAAMRGRRVMPQGAWSEAHKSFPLTLSGSLSEELLQRLYDTLGEVLNPSGIDQFFKIEHGGAPNLLRTRALQVAYLIDESS